jgi:uncharacterized membrane protein YjjP (DUF1212 family)
MKTLRFITIALIVLLSSVIHSHGASQADIDNFLNNYALLEDKQEMKVEADWIYTTTDCELTKQEAVKVKRFIRKFKRDTVKMVNIQKVAYAIQLLSKTAEYETGKRKLIDVLNGKTNCQGYAMMLHELMNVVNIENELIITKNHIWNVVDGEKIDMTLLYSIYRR